MSDHRSPRVNKARMADFKGQTVRLIAKIVNVRSHRQFLNRASRAELRGQFRDDVAIVEASDGGEVEVKMLKVRFGCHTGQRYRAWSDRGAGREDRRALHRGYRPGGGRADDQDDGLRTAGSQRRCVAFYPPVIPSILRARPSQT